MPTSLDIRSIIITFTSNLSVDDSSCLNNLSLKPVDPKMYCNDLYISVS